MDNNLHSFFLKGKKNYQISMPSEICSIAKMIMNKTTECNHFIVCLKNGTIRIYNDKNLVSSIETNVGANGIIFGMYGREEGCLVINSSSGGMMAKIMKRKANLTAP